MVRQTAPGRAALRAVPLLRRHRCQRAERAGAGAVAGAVRVRARHQWQHARPFAFPIRLRPFLLHALLQRRRHDLRPLRFLDAPEKSPGQNHRRLQARAGNGAGAAPELSRQQSRARWQTEPAFHLQDTGRHPDAGRQIQTCARLAGQSGAELRALPSDWRCLARRAARGKETDIFGADLPDARAGDDRHDARAGSGRARGIGRRRFHRSESRCASGRRIRVARRTTARFDRRRGLGPASRS